MKQIQQKQNNKTPTSKPSSKKPIKLLQNDIPSVYEDKFIKITQYYILIDKYYFPLATSKIIFYQDIKAIYLKQTKNLHTIWGLSRSELNHWFHLDLDRKNKDYFISIQLKQRNIKVGVSAQRLIQAYNVLMSVFMKNYQKNHIKKSQQTNKKEVQKSNLSKSCELTEQQINGDEGIKNQIMVEISGLIMNEKKLK